MLVDADACFSLEYGKEPVRRQRSFESGDELGIVIEGDVRRFPEVRSPKLLHKPRFPHLPGSAHDERLFVEEILSSASYLRWPGASWHPFRVIHVFA